MPASDSPVSLRTSIHRKIQEIISETLGLEGLELSEATTASEVKGWDSFAHINIITGIEKHYGLRFRLGELDQLKNVGDMISLVAKYQP